ncbi:MAG TPA: YdbL family protein [Parvularculaceae bacterium]|nr:YdbL family protein [Parvularculaceae bacterium]
MRTKILGLALAVGVAIAGFAGAALAASPAIEKAKSECIVGEQTDGYLGVKEPAKASTDLKREVDSVNLQRKAAYAQLAEKNGVSIEDTAALFAEKLINNAPAGQCYRDQDGNWQQK